LGYNVFEVPFNPLKINILETFIKGIKEGDAMKAFK
jgi:hypothetical protein